MSPIDLKGDRIRFSYLGSDPSGVGMLNEDYVPAPDLIRLWRTNGPAARNPAAVNAQGDYVTPNVAYELKDFGIAGEHATLIVYVEGISVSTADGDAAISVTFDPDGDGPQGEVGCPQPKKVNVTVLDTKLVEATGHTTAEERPAMMDSHSAPWFTNLQAHLTNPQPSQDESA